VDNSISLPVLFSAIGAAGGLLLQQGIDVWKTKTTHRQELQRRFFEVKLQTAIDLARALDVLVASHQARLAEAAERTREDENFVFLALSREAMNIHGKALEKDYDRYAAVFAVLELVFTPAVVSSATENGVAVELTNTWREFDEEWYGLVSALNKLIPDSRMDEFRGLRELGQVDQGAFDEMARWMAVYKSRNATIRAYLPRLAELTLRAEQHRRTVLLAIREELKPYYL
jgi:hypothetical protein